MENLKRGLLSAIIFALFAGVQAQAYQPDLDMDLDGFEQEALRQKEDVWVVDFWASWCKPCIRSIPHMKKLHSKYQDQGVKFISVSWDRNVANWMNALEHFKMPWSHLIVPKGEEAWLEEQFPHRGIPTVFVIDRDGKVKKVKDVYKLDKAIYKVL